MFVSKTTFVQLVIFILIYWSMSFAQYKEFIRDYEFDASETDSKITARKKALSIVKDLLLEEIGTYVEKEILYIQQENTINGKSNYYENFKNKIKSITGGVVSTKILYESWNGKTYYIKVKMILNEKEMLEKLNKINFNNNIDNSYPKQDVFLSISNININDLYLSNGGYFNIKNNELFIESRFFQPIFINKPLPKSFEVYIEFFVDDYDDQFIIGFSPKKNWSPNYHLVIRSANVEWKKVSGFDNNTIYGSAKKEYLIKTRKINSIKILKEKYFLTIFINDTFFKLVKIDKNICYLNNCYMFFSSDKGSTLPGRIHITSLHIFYL